MMNKLWMLLAAPALVTCVINDAVGNDFNSTNDHRHMYLGVGAAFASVDVSGTYIGDYFSQSLDGSLIGAMAGYQLHQNFAFEVRGYGNLSDDNINGVDVSLDHHFSALARGILPIDEYFRPYVLLGYGTSKASVAGLSDDGEDIIYGVGLAISNGNKVQLEVEWTRLYDEKFSGDGYAVKLAVDTVNVNLVYHF
jgi:opacity protein-like surface antigen